MDEREKKEQPVDEKWRAESQRLLWEMDTLIERAKALVLEAPRSIRVAVLKDEPPEKH